MTTASKTDFVLAPLEVAGYTFYFDGNQKVTAGNGDFENPQPNAFSLIQVADCPFSTFTCRSSCYVHNLEKFQESVHEHYKSNSAAIRDFLDKAYLDPDKYQEVVSVFGEWIEDNAKGGFRWHVSGDVFSAAYATFISDVCKASPEVQHWIYTRSFPYLERLFADNLTINLSADKDNYWLARQYADRYNLRVCYLTIDGEVPDDLKKGDVIFPDYGLRGVDQKPFEFRNDSKWWKSLSGLQKKMTCPVDIYGKSEQVRCGPCRKCLD